MNKHWILSVFIVLITALLLAGCATPSEAPPLPTNVPPPTDVPPTAVPEPTAVPVEAEPSVALKITGLVTNEMGWTEAEVRAMETMTVDYTNKDGVTSSYTGVSLSALLALAGPKAEAAAIVFIADDGYSAEGTLAEILACADCIVAFNDDGGFRMILPDLSSKLQVKGVIEIQLK